MTASADLERRYRRLLGWYPATFRREHEAEMLGVLMDSARDGQQRAGLADSADLIKRALTLRLRVPSQAPRTVAAAIRLMYVGAAAYLAGWISTVVTEGSVRSAMARSTPGRWHLMFVHVTGIEVAAPAMGITWLCLAWANGRGYDRARRALVPWFGVSTLGLLFMLGYGAAVYAAADLISLSVLWLIELSVVVLVFNPRSAPFYRLAEASAS
jgi:hypothetical protein